MGLNYKLKCLGCKVFSKEIEFCVTKKLSVKVIPDELYDIQNEWVAFLIEHSGHCIAVEDSYGRWTDPTKITGTYVLFGKETEQK